jgi:hypothetical protein
MRRALLLAVLLLPACAGSTGWKDASPESRAFFTNALDCLDKYAVPHRR